MQWADPVILGRWLQLLDGAAFVALGNALLSEFAATRGIDRACLATNLRVTEPDGGIDARCVNTASAVGRLIPRSNVDYQFKSGSEAKSAASIAENDILGKPRVRQGLQDGHAFVYVAAWDRGDAIEEDIVQRLRNQGLAVDDDQIVFFGQDAVARLLQTFPSLVARFLNLDLPLHSLEDWARVPSLSNPFQLDESIEARLSDLGSRVTSSRSITRVVGAAGDGKTRTVLEALKRLQLAPTVLYARQVSDVTPSFIAHLRRTPDVQCTLVIDEVDDAEAARLTDWFSVMPDGVRLILIGLDASGRAQRGTLQVEGLSSDLLVAAIAAIVPGLPEETTRSIARDCEHSPKLAVLIAGRIKEDPSLVAPHRILADGTVWNTLDRYLSIGQNSPEWEALSTTALLMRLGWLEEAESESEVLFGAVNLDPIIARRHVQRLHERFGIAPLAGRFRYVSPAILGDFLAAKQLDAWTRDRLTSVLAALTPAMADSFARRARRLSAVLSNRAVIEEVILGDQGPFRTLDDLEASKIAMVLRHLAAPFPRATLAALRRTIGEATNEELRTATTSRRDVVWALEELLWPQDTFEGAADILLRLALAENETWGNNATATWIETFQTALGRTAAGLAARARVLRRSAISQDPRERLLCTRALGAALKFEHLHRSGRPPEDVEGMPTQEWIPATWGEWSDAVIIYLDLLTPLLSDEDATVRKAAVDSLREGIAASLHLPRVIDYWIASARTLIGTDYTLRISIVDAIAWARIRWERRLENGNLEGEEDSNNQEIDEATRSSAQTALRERLDKLVLLEDELRGNDFSSRFRSTLTLTTRGAFNEEERGSEQQHIIRELESLASEVILQPELLVSEWEWLLENGDWSTIRWFQILGRLDRDRIFGATIQRFALQSPRAVMWMSLYDIAYSQATQDPSFIDTRIAELKAIGIPSGQIFDLLYRAGYQPSRIAVILELLSSGDIPGEVINQLAYSPWGAAIPSNEALEIVRVATGHTDHPGVLIPFIYNYLMQVKDAVGIFRDLAVELIGHPHATTDSSDTMFRYEWSQLALMYIDEVPNQVASAALKQMASGEFVQDGDIHTVLERAWKVGDKVYLFTEVFAPAFTAGWPNGWYVRRELSGFPFADLSVQFLTNWVAADPEERAAALADVIGPPSGQFSDLHAALLEQFDVYGVGNAFYTSFMSGSWMGSASGWTRSKLEVAQQWLNDARPVVRDWASNIVRDLQEELKRNEAREAEERFFL